MIVGRGENVTIQQEKIYEKILKWMFLEKWSMAACFSLVERWKQGFGNISKRQKKEEKLHKKMNMLRAEWDETKPEWSVSSFLSILPESEFESVKGSPHKTNVFCG